MAAGYAAVVATEEEAGVMSITWAVLSAVLKIASLVLVGAKLEHQRVLDTVKRKALSALAMDVCLPCLLFVEVLPEANLNLLREGWQLLLWPVVYAIVGACAGLLSCCLAGAPSQHWGAAAACAAFPNVNGFPVSIINALGKTLPRSSAGFSAMTFLAIIQLTDGMVKYTIGPAVFRRDLRAVQRARRARGEDSHGEMPLGASLRSIRSSDLAFASRQNSPVSGKSIDIAQESRGKHSVVKQDSLTTDDGHVGLPPRHRSDSASGEVVTEWGLTVEQFQCVEPDWSRFDSGKLLWTGGAVDLTRTLSGASSVTGRGLGGAGGSLHKPLLDGGGAFDDIEDDSAGDGSEGEGGAAPGKGKGRRGGLSRRLQKVARQITIVGGSCFDVFRELFPPQVVAVVLAVAIGICAPWLKLLLIDPTSSGQPALGWVFGTAKELGGGFVPLQMISLGGRMLNVVGPSGPLAAKGAAGPRGRARLLRIGAAVGIARMIVAPAILFVLARALDAALLKGKRSLAFWAPALIVAAMPTANNMSTMADLVGSGRSISAASTAMQLVASPVVLAATLTLLISGAKFSLAADFAGP